MERTREEKIEYLDNYCTAVDYCCNCLFSKSEDDVCDENTFAGLSEDELNKAFQKVFNATNYVGTLVSCDTCSNVSNDSECDYCCKVCDEFENSNCYPLLYVPNTDMVSVVEATQYDGETKWYVTEKIVSPRRKKEEPSKEDDFPCGTCDDKLSGKCDGTSCTMDHGTDDNVAEPIKKPKHHYMFGVMSNLVGNQGVLAHYILSAYECLIERQNLDEARWYIEKARFIIKIECNDTHEDVVNAIEYALNSIDREEKE